MHFAGDASSGALCLKNAEEGRFAIFVTADIPPHYTTMQLLNGTRKRSLKIRKKSEANYRNSTSLCIEVLGRKATPNPHYTL